jgi:hypothetical protein
MKRIITNILLLNCYLLHAQTQLGSDIDGEAADDRSGVSVSMNSAGDRVAIGALKNDGTGTNAGHVRVYGLAQYTPDPPTLVINELLGRNVACCTDANGDYDSYIELFNYGDEEVDIGGMVITDEDDYYQIQAGEYISTKKMVLLK